MTDTGTSNAVATANTGPADGPNVVQILVDDLGYADVGAYGSEMIRTPNIDDLAESGVRCTTGYVTSPWCAPSRQSVLSGLQPNRHSSFESPWMGDFFREAGYATGFVGKVHAHRITGFEEFYGFFDGMTNYLPRDGEPVTMQRGGSRDAEVRPESCETEVEPEYLTDGFSREAVQFVEDRSGDDAPFALCLHYNAPHTLLEATEEYLERYPDLEGDMRTYAAMVSAIDDGVVSSMDLLPTFLGAAGVEYDPDQFDGVNLLPYLTGEADSDPHDTLYFQRRDWTEIEQRFVDRQRRIGDTEATWIVRKPDAKLLGTEDELGAGDEPLELYELERDRSEQDDRLADRPGDVEAWTDEREAFVEATDGDWTEDWFVARRAYLDDD